MNIRPILKQISQDRALMASWLVLALICLIVTILLAFKIHPSELNTQVRYTSFGITHIYSNAWYNLLPMVVFSLTVLALHTVIATKILLNKDKYLARLFIWLSIATLVIGTFMGVAVLDLASI